jgi:hypothetical protein
MGADQPLPQLFRGLVGGGAIKRHQGGRNARRLHDAGPPAIGVDRRDFDEVRAAGDGFFKASSGYRHGAGLLKFAMSGNAKGFYASQIDDQAKDGTKGTCTTDRRPDLSEEEIKKNFAVGRYTGNARCIHSFSTA